MIIIRDDDILVASRSYSDPTAQFRHVHELIKSAPNFLHVPTILVSEIQEFPTVIELIKEETANGFMQPECHGLHHIDYGKLSKEEVVEHLKICKDFMFNQFNVIPKKFYTPWGAFQPHIHEAAAEVDMIVIGVNNALFLEGKGGMIEGLKAGRPMADFDGAEFLWHWWNAGSRLARVCAVARYGSWEEASKAQPKLFRE